MSTKKKFTKYLVIIALFAMSALIVGCKENIDTPVAVTSITVSGEAGAITVENGSSLQMAATVLPAEATDKSVTWSVANVTGTATIGATGLLEATEDGTVTVKATANDGSGIEGTKVITISVFTVVTGITVTSAEDASEVILDETLQMSVTIIPGTATDPSVTWSVVEGEGLGKGKATISTEGLLTGKVAGTVIVKATANDSTALEGTKEITVNSHPFTASVFPLDLAEGVAIATLIEASFNEEMDSLTMISDNFTVSVSGGSAVSGVVSYDAVTKTMTFDPVGDLEYETEYTATVTTVVKDSSGLAMLEDKEWIFTTATAALAGEGPAVINLRSASNFAILAKTAITTTGNTEIKGDIGVSPAALSDLTGFSETLADDGTSATSIYVDGKIYASNMQEPAPSMLTTAISDVEAAYTEAAGRGAADYEVKDNLYGGTLDGQIFAPGIYKWSTVVTMDTDITIKGGPNDTWIFQISGNFTAGSGAKVTLEDGAQAKNIFWQVSEIVTLNPGAHLEGIILGMTQVKILTGASVHGKLFAQSQVTLDTATVTPL